MFHFICDQCDYKTMYAGPISFCPMCGAPNPNLEICPSCKEKKLEGQKQNFCHICGFSFKTTNPA